MRRTLDRWPPWGLLGCAGVAAAFCSAVWPDAAWAELVWRNGRWVDTGRYRGSDSVYLEISLIRLLLIGGSTALGFGIGWFFSPHARDLRQAIAIIAGLVLLGIALFNYDILGWSVAGLMAVVGFCCGIGYWLAQSVQRLLETPKTFGSAEWANAEHLHERGMFKTKKGLLLGTAFNGSEMQKISYTGDRHLFTFAPTRSGKGVSHISPNLLEHDASVLVIDPKGENAMITAKARQEMGQEVIVMDPWNIACDKLGIKPARLNPFDWIINNPENAAENAILLADSLVQKDKKGNDVFWDEESKSLFMGLILLVAFDETYEGRRNLGTVRDLLLLGSAEQKMLFEYMANSSHPLIASSGTRSLQKDEKLFSNVMASAQAETHMLDSEKLRDALSASDFSFADLKKMPMSIYIIIPADRLDTYSRFLRLMVQQAITMNARNIADQPEKPVLFLLDEMPALGRLAMVEQAYGLMAGFGIQLWGIAQDLCALRRVYGEDYETFIANSGAVMYFGSPDKTSTEYFSAMCGETTVWNFSSALASAFSSSSGQGGGSHSNSTTSTDNRAAAQRKLAYPDELRRLPEDLQLVLVEHTNPIMAGKIRWYEDPELKAKGVNTRANA